MSECVYVGQYIFYIYLMELHFTYMYCKPINEFKKYMFNGYSI